MREILLIDFHYEFINCIGLEGLGFVIIGSHILIIEVWGNKSNLRNGIWGKMLRDLNHMPEKISHSGPHDRMKK